MVRLVVAETREVVLDLVIPRGNLKADGETHVQIHKVLPYTLIHSNSGPLAVPQTVYCSPLDP